MALRSIELCAGYGGLGLGIELAVPGSRSVCLVEREAYLAAGLVEKMEAGILAAAPVFSDVRTFDGKPWRGKVDCVTGGYPCQPFSIAGKRLGTADPRHLWPDIARIVGEVQPAYCFFENVDDHLRLGYEQVAQDLDAMGYEPEAGIFSSSETGASHVRERLYILAQRRGLRQAQPPRGQRDAGSEVRGAHGEGGRNGAIGNHPDGPSGSLEDSNEPRLAQRSSGEIPSRSKRPSGASGPLGSPKGREHDGRGDGQERGEGRPTEPGGLLGDPKSRGRLESERRSEGGIEPLEASNGRMGSPMRRRHGHPEEEIFAGRLPVEPPGRFDDDGWERVLAGFPGLAPAAAAKPALRGMANESAYWLDRIDEVRAIGNGVDPVVAAVAFSTLWHRLNA